jgi:hypothetical protein
MMNTFRRDFILMPVECIVALVPWPWVLRNEKQVLERKQFSLVTVLEWDGSAIAK